MKASVALLGALLLLVVVATPALAVADDLAGGNITEGSSYAPNSDFTHAEFGHYVTNLIEEPVEVTPRDLRMVEYPIMTVTEITAGTFDDGIWTVGTLQPGQTASITYTGDAAPVATTTTVPPTTSTTEPPQTSTTIASATTVAPAATTTTAPEELPHTGQRDHLATLALTGLALIGLGASLLRATRD